MISDKGLQNEAEIVWEAPIEDLDYVRESMRLTETRTEAVPYKGEGRRVGYAVLEEDASGVAPKESPLPFERRVFYLEPHDRPDGDAYGKGCPTEAVDPRTVEPGKRGEETPRVRGEKSP